MGALEHVRGLVGRSKARWLLAGLLGVVVTASCQAILGIEEGKPRTSGSGGAGVGGAGAGGATGGAGGAGGMPLGCLDTGGSGPFRWGQVWGGAGVDAAKGVSIDSDGHIVVVGTYDSPTATIAEVELSCPGASCTRGFVARLAGNGEPDWVLELVGTLNAVPMAVAHGDDAEIYVVGSYQGAFDVYAHGEAQAVGHLEPPIGNGAAAFVVKLAADGAVLWAQRIHADRSATEAGTASSLAVAVDTTQARNPWVAGWFRGALTVVDAAGAESRSDSWAAGFVATLASDDGTHVGHQAFLSPAYASAVAQAVVAAPPTNAVVGGLFQQELYYGDGGSMLEGVGGANAAWHARVTPVGTVHSPTWWAGTRTGELTGLAAYPPGTFYATGTFEGSIELGAFSASDSSGQDSFVAAFDTNGEVLWATALSAGASSLVRSQALGAGREGEIVVGGSVDGTQAGFNFGCGLLGTTSSRDAFVVKLRREVPARCLYSHVLRDGGLSMVNALAVDGCGVVVAVGVFDSVEPAPLLTPGQGEPLGTLLPIGNGDAFVIVLGP